MSTRRPAKFSFFGYSPRMPLSEETAPPGAPDETAELAPDQWAAPLADEEESALVERARTESGAFGQLYERYVDRVYSYIYHRVGNVQDAEDLTARTFYRALEKLDTYEDRGLPFSAWLFRIAHNLVANWHRDNSRRKEVPLDDTLLVGQSSLHPEHELLQTEERDRLLQVVRCLPAERQQLLILKFVDHLSNAEIGAIMGRTEGAVKSLYHRTLLSIRDELGAAGLQVSEDGSEEYVADYYG